ncbi:MAG: hypothetical protein ABIV50_08280 [Opitutus sp.]
MDAKRASPLTAVAVLLALGITVVVAGVAWPAWDMFGPARRPMLQGWDDSFYYFWLPSVVIDHDLDFSNQLAQSGTIDPATRDLALTLPKTRTGVLDSKYPPGWALGSLPFFLIAHAFSAPGATGFEPVYLVSVWLGQLLYAVLGLGIALKILTRYFSFETAALATLAGWLTSSLVYYQTARLSMSHSQVFTLAVTVFWISFQISDGDLRVRHWSLLGFAAALLVVTRNVAFVYLTLPAAMVLPKLRLLRHAGWILAGAAVPIIVQLVAWKIIHGSWIAYSYGGERFDFRHLRVLEVLVSPQHGWFYWHPLMLPAIGVFMAWAWHRREGRAWLISLLAIVILSAAWPTWWLGSSFGYRGFEVLTFFAMIGVAALLEVFRRPSLPRMLLRTVIACAIAGNLALFALFLTQRIPREEPVTYQQAAHAFRTWVTGGRR